MTTGMHFGASKEIFQYAEALRKNMTEAEKIIWERASKNQLGIRIRRQHPIWKFIADFYCHELGIEIIRFTNDQVINDTERIVGEIKETIEALKQKQTLVPKRITNAD